ncbi:hypothetical protein MRX96_033891 [Rhipicephalus microplus]
MLIRGRDIETTERQVFGHPSNVSCLGHLVTLHGTVSKQLLLDNFVQATCHPFYAGFRLIGRLQRLTGCCFLENISSERYEDVRARRFSSYLLYPLCIWIYFIAVAIVIIMDAEQHKHGVRDTELLNKTILLASIVALNFESALNNVMLMYRAPRPGRATAHVRPHRVAHQRATVQAATSGAVRLECHHLPGNFPGAMDPI